MSVELLLAPVPQLLEVQAVASKLGFSPEWVRKLIRLGKLPAVRFGRCWRIKAQDVRALVEAHEQQIAREEQALDRRFVDARARTAAPRRL